MKQEEQKDYAEKTGRLAGKVMEYAKDAILVNLRFLGGAVSAVGMQEKRGLHGAETDGRLLYYDPVWLLKKYKEEPAFAARLFLHVLLHLIFYHSFSYDKVERDYWDLAVDLAVENTILEMEIPGFRLKTDETAKNKLRVLKEETSVLTAERIYRYLKNNRVSERRCGEMRALFFRDEHKSWEQREELVITLEQWKKLSRMVQADLKSFSRGKNHSESMESNLGEALKDRYDYAALLKRFMVMNEDMQINDDEFDYIYYTYGLEHYGNMPLIEPLEYKDSKKIREFVIALDTSASCRGPVVRAFLQKTYSILTGEDTFFKKMNVHILQCDSEVRKDTKITSKEDLDYFLANETLSGFGSTDFRPVFFHVEKLLLDKELENLKGLIYFTDGYGIYPQGMPPYDVMFVFLDNGDEGPEVPPWAVKVMLPYEELEEEERRDR